MTSAYAELPGIRMHFEREGAGPPLVLLHGSLMTADLTFRALRPRLAERHDVILPELQGHGHTAESERPTSLDHLAADVVALLAHLGVARADVMGFSLGGWVALHTALGTPERVRRLVVASAPLAPDGAHRDTQPGTADFASPRMPTAKEFAALAEAYRRVAPDPTMWETTAAKIQALVAGFAGWPREDLARLLAPTLLLVGDTDFVRLEHAVEAVGWLPHAWLGVLPHTRHMDVTRRVDAVLAMLEPFLAGEDASA